MLLFGEAVVELGGEGVFAGDWCGGGSEGGEGGEGGGGTEGAEDLAAADGLAVKGGEKGIHAGIFSEVGGKDQWDLWRGGIGGGAGLRWWCLQTRAWTRGL